MSVNQIEGAGAGMAGMDRKPNGGNLRTGLILAAIALAFFLSVIVKRVALG